jgi:hypothetical protein
MLCEFSSFEEIDTPERDPRTPRIAVWHEIDRAKRLLNQSHREWDCQSRTFFSFREGTPYRQDLRNIPETAGIAAWLINR